jgi:hypothetical protein
MKVYIFHQHAKRSIYYNCNLRKKNDGLVGHHWKERPIGHANCICRRTGERQGQKWEWVGREMGERVGGNFWDSILNVIKENT